MRNQCAAIAKRALAFVLVLVLLLTLLPAFPITADAAYTTDGWEYASNYTWLAGRFHSDDADLNFVDNQPYDWSVSIYQNRTTVTVTVDATVKDSSGAVVASISNKSVSSVKGVDSTMLSASDLRALTTELYGSFTLTCTIKYNGAMAAQLTKTFKRTSSSLFTSTITSRSNPDNVFTFADPIDLVLNIKKIDGTPVAYNAAITVTKKGSTEVLNGRGISLPASTNVSLIVKDLVNLTSITTAGIYSVNLTLTDSTGKEVYKKSNDFAVVALEGSVTATVTSATTPSLVFNNVVPDLQINLQKNDGIAENLTTVVKVTGTSTWSKSFTTTSTSNTLTPDLSSLPNPGNYMLTATITDDAGNPRGSVTASFSRTNVTPMNCSLYNYNPNATGKIYSVGDDFELSLSINHAASAGKTMNIQAVGTLNGEPFVSNTKKATLSKSGAATVTIDGTMLGGYGIFEDVSIEVYDASGNRMWKSAQTYSFSRVLSTARPGDLDLVNMNFHFTNNTGSAETKLQLGAQAGSAMWRTTITWASVERTKGFYDMPDEVESVFNYAEWCGMEPLIILAYNNDLYGEANPNNAEWLTGYTNYCKYIASQMKGSVTYYEIWNEWNADMGKVPSQYRTGRNYAILLVAASKAIKSVDPDAKIIGGAPAGDVNVKKWIDAVLRYDANYDGKSDTMAAIDGFSFHTYATDWSTCFYSPTEHNYPNRVNSVISQMNQYGDASTKEIWITETGWSTCEGVGVTEEEQAAYLVQLYAWALAHPDMVDRIFWYDMLDHGTDPSVPEQHWGVLHNWDAEVPYAAKKSYPALCAFTSMMDGASNATTLNWGNGIYAYQFEKDGNFITVAWTSGDTVNLTANLNGSMVITDMYGNSTTYSGTAPLTLSECPIYIEYSNASHPTIG